MKQAKAIASAALCVVLTSFFILFPVGMERIADLRKVATRKPAGKTAQSRNETEKKYDD